MLFTLSVNGIAHNVHILETEHVVMLSRHDNIYNKDILTRNMLFFKQC